MGKKDAGVWSGGSRRLVMGGGPDGEMKSPVSCGARTRIGAV